MGGMLSNKANVSAAIKYPVLFQATAMATINPGTLVQYGERDLALFKALADKGLIETSLVTKFGSNIQALNKVTAHDNQANVLLSNALNSYGEVLGDLVTRKNLRADVIKKGENGEALYEAIKAANGRAVDAAENMTRATEPGKVVQVGLSELQSLQGTLMVNIFNAAKGIEAHLKTQNNSNAKALLESLPAFSTAADFKLRTVSRSRLDEPAAAPKAAEITEEQIRQAIVASLSTPVPALSSIVEAYKSIGGDTKSLESSLARIQSLKRADVESQKDLVIPVLKAQLDSFSEAHRLLLDLERDIGRGLKGNENQTDSEFYKYTEARKKRGEAADAVQKALNDLIADAGASKTPKELYARIQALNSAQKSFAEAALVIRDYASTVKLAGTDLTEGDYQAFLSKTSPRLNRVYGAIARSFNLADKPLRVEAAAAGANSNTNPSGGTSRGEPAKPATLPPREVGGSQQRHGISYLDPNALGVNQATAEAIAEAFINNRPNQWIQSWGLSAPYFSGKRKGSGNPQAKKGKKEENKAGESSPAVDQEGFVTEVAFILERAMLKMNGLWDFKKNEAVVKRNLTQEDSKRATAIKARAEDIARIELDTIGDDAGERKLRLMHVAALCMEGQEMGRTNSTVESWSRRGRMFGGMGNYHGASFYGFGSMYGIGGVPGYFAGWGSPRRRP